MKLRMILAALILVTCSIQVTHTKHAVPESPETIEQSILVSNESASMLPRSYAADEVSIPHAKPDPEETEEVIAEIEALSVPELTEEDIPSSEVLPSSVAEPEEPPSAPAPPATLPRQRAVDGQKELWVPGFGWIPDEGGGGTECTITDSDGDINKMVGHM